MKIIIAGSRTIDGSSGYLEVVAAIKDALATWGAREVTEVVTGEARGVDTLGGQIAEKFGIAHREFPADWDGLGKSAGFIRNKQMADYADALILVWDGKSKGSAMMKKIAEDKGMLVHERVVD